MTGLVLSCEHASWQLPAGVELGVSAEVRASQAGWDHGALDVARRLGDALGLPVHTGTYTRMFVDLNRPPDHPDVIPVNSYGAPVPGNALLTPGDRAARIAQFHAPYWDAVRRDVRAALAARGACLHFSSHTFDPSLDPERRQFDVGVLYDPAHGFEAELAERLIAQLAAAGLEVRANEPYHGTGPAICTRLREELAGERYAGIQLETSHAVTHTPDGSARVAAAAHPFLAAVAARPSA